MNRRKYCAIVWLYIFKELHIQEFVVVPLTGKLCVFKHSQVKLGTKIMLSSTWSRSDISVVGCFLSQWQGMRSHVACCGLFCIRSYFIFRKSETFVFYWELLHSVISKCVNLMISLKIKAEFFSPKKSPGADVSCRRAHYRLIGLCYSHPMCPT